MTTMNERLTVLNRLLNNKDLKEKLLHNLHKYKFGEFKIDWSPSKLGTVSYNKIDKTLEKDIINHIITITYDHFLNDLSWIEINAEHSLKLFTVYNESMIFNNRTTFEDNVLFNNSVEFNHHVEFKGRVKFNQYVTFCGKVLFNKQAKFGSYVNFYNDVKFDKQVMFNSYVQFFGNRTEIVKGATFNNYVIYRIPIEYKKKDVIFKSYIHSLTFHHNSYYQRTVFDKLSQIEALKLPTFDAEGF